MNFNTNQNRHLFVVSNNDSIVPVQDNAFYLSYTNPKGEALRSDIVSKDTIVAITCKKAAEFKRALQAYKIALKGDLVKGEDYIVKIFVEVFGVEDKLVKVAGVYASNSMTVANFYEELAKQLTAAFKGTNFFTFEADATGVVVKEVKQEFEVARTPDAPLMFQIAFSAIDGEVWGEATAVANTEYVGNGRMLADLEYFCMGERGDQYRFMGYPNTLNVAYKVNPELEYDVLDIHYYFVDSNEGVQKSEKDLTIISNEEGVVEALYNEIVKGTKFEVVE